jgi:hypothetical protein
MSDRSSPGAYILWDNDISVLRFDAVKSEVQERTNLITEHPVESGANITDHIRPNLNKVTLEAFVSNSPLQATQQLQVSEPLSLPSPPNGALLNGLINTIGSIISPERPVVAQVLEFPGGAPDFVASTIDALETLRSQGIIVKVICPNATYESMILEGFEVHRDANTGDSATFEINLREIRVVSSSLTAAPQPTIPRAAPMQNKGDQASEKPPQSSELSNILSGLGVGL